MHLGSIEARTLCVGWRASRFLFESLLDHCCLWIPLLEDKTPVLLEQGQEKCAETHHSVQCVQGLPLSVCREPPLSMCRDPSLCVCRDCHCVCVCGARKGSRVQVSFEKILGEADHAFPLCQASREIRVIRILPASLGLLLSDAQLPWLLSLSCLSASLFPSDPTPFFPLLFHMASSRKCPPLPQLPPGSSLLTFYLFSLPTPAPSANRKIKAISKMHFVCVCTHVRGVCSVCMRV